MSREQTKKILIGGLNATGAEVVYCNISQIAEVVGIEEAEALHTPGTLVETQEAIKFKRVEGSRAVDQTYKSGIAEFNRERLLAALEASE